MAFELMTHQSDAVDFLDSGKILYGQVGTGKSATALAYYVKKESPKDIYVITTAKKRDTLEWNGEAAKFGIGLSRDETWHGVLNIDSWNNVDKYTFVKDAFFIFDEQRVVGHGSWVKSFLKIANNNRWILLSATPGDTWLDYAPVFIANGWYKNITDFKRQHVVYAPYVKFPKVIRYLGEQKLERLRNEILVEMQYDMPTRRNVNFLDVAYDIEKLENVMVQRWNVYENRPIKDVAELFRVARRVLNSDYSRLDMVRYLLTAHPRIIVFYNFDYELEILRTLQTDIVVGEWNGHRKDPIPESDEWVYLVQYTAGGEGWNCTSTNAMVLYSLTYSYKGYIQAQGRIDRLNTSYTDLYYYVFMTSAKICRAIKSALDAKKSFNEREFAKSTLFGNSF